MRKENRAKFSYLIFVPFIQDKDQQTTTLTKIACKCFESNFERWIQMAIIREHLSLLNPRLSGEEKEEMKVNDFQGMCVGTLVALAVEVNS